MAVIHVEKSLFVFVLMLLTKVWYDVYSVQGGTHSWTAIELANLVRNELSSLLTLWFFFDRA